MTADERKDVIATVNEWAENQDASVLLLGGGGPGDSPEDYAAAIIGVVDTPRPAVVYLRSRVIEELIRLSPDATYDDMEEYYDFNIVRALPYMEKDNPPILVDDMFT